MAYLLDADVFIRAKNLHYGLDFCPGFWDWLVAGNESGRVFSVEKVGDEVQAGADELSDWAAGRGDAFFLHPDASIFPALAEVSEWVNGQAYEAAAVSEWVNGQAYEAAAVSTFLQVADYWLVAQARAGEHTVVTHEIPSASIRRVKIPDACIGLGIRCVTPFEMLRRREGAFRVGSTPGRGWSIAQHNVLTARICRARFAGGKAGYAVDMNAEDFNPFHECSSR